jgi:hypothetical protein
MWDLPLTRKTVLHHGRLFRHPEEKHNGMKLGLSVSIDRDRERRYVLIIETFIWSVGRMVRAKWLAGKHAARTRLHVQTCMYALVPFFVDVSLTELKLKFFFSYGSCLKTITYKVRKLANAENKQ